MSRLTRAVLAAATCALVVPAALLAPEHAAAVVGCAATAGTNDLDGDGYDDAVVGDPYADVGGALEAGNVLVLFGDADGRIGEGRRLVITQNLIADTSEANDYFGSSVAVGDVTGDGCADLVVGSPGERREGDVSGLVHLITFLPPDAEGFSEPDAVDIDQTMVIGGTVEESDDFGSTVAVGTRPGQPGVIAVTALGQRVAGQAYAGEVDLFDLAETDGLSHGRRLVQGGDGIPGTPADNDYFGRSLAFGPLPWPVAGGSPAAGLSLLIGAPGDEIGGKDAAGSVTAYEISGSGRQQWTQNSLGVGGAVENGDRFGDALAVLGASDDAPGLLAVGAPNENFPHAARTGMVQLFSVTDDITPTLTLHQNTPGVPGASEDDDRFGGAITIRPSDRRLAVASTSEALGRHGPVGWLQTFDYDDGTATVTASTAYSGNAIAPGRIRGTQFAWSLATIDGLQEDVIVVGSPSADGGSVLIISDSPTTPTRSWIATALGIPGAHQLGWSVTGSV